jgi:hypothetical protein
MEERIVIRKKKSSLYLALSEALLFSVLALLFVIFPEAGGSVRKTAVILFGALSLIGWGMIIDYMKSALIIAEEGIIAKGPLGKEKRISWDEIISVGAEKSFLFIYGKKNKILASLDASLAENPQALAAFRAHGKAVYDHHFRRRKEK